MNSLSDREIHKIVYRYIGVDGGYLGDFSYRSHHDLYIDLDLDINPHEYEGTTRERFMKILSESDPHTQAIILDGILEKYPVDSSELRTKKRHAEIKLIIARLQGAAPVESPKLHVTTKVVEAAINDAESLLKTNGPVSAIDRIHTALHGYLKTICEEEGIGFGKDPSLTYLFKLVRESHPKFKNNGKHKELIDKILRSMSSVIDSINLIRNRGSLAHANEALLNEEEAMLTINICRTILHYFNSKIKVDR